MTFACTLAKAIQSLSHISGTKSMKWDVGTVNCQFPLRYITIIGLVCYLGFM